MKRLILIISLSIITASTVHATLVDNGDGTITQTRSDGSVLMWLQDANYAKSSGYDSDGKMTWYDAMTWAGSLDFAGYSDWRLPTTLPYNGHTFDEVRGYDGTNDRGYNVTHPGNEMSYMYYIELGNISIVDTSNNPQDNWGLNNIGPFISIRTDQLYWTGTESTSDPDNAWDYFFDRGDSGISGKKGSEYAWAVRTVSVVPEPISLVLFTIGGVTLGIRQWRNFK